MSFQKLKQNLKEHWDIWVLGLVILVSLFLHLWHFNDWLLFRADQARDSFYAKDAYENGIGHLRILGPKIDMAYIEGDKNKRGDTLHIGPFYYYQQYLSMRLFGTTDPWTIAVPDLVMFLLSIPLFYILCRQFFGKLISISATSLYSFSFFNLIYSRFSWNPNQLFFWIVLLVLGLVKSSEEQDKRKKGWWFVVVFFCILVISQIHFLAFVGFLVLVFAFIIKYKIRAYTTRQWMAIAGLFLVFNFPIAVSELKNNWDNSKRFWVAIHKDQGDPDGVLGKLESVLDKNSEFFVFNLTSYQDREINGIEKMGTAFFLFSVFLLFYLYFGKREYLPHQKKFAFLMLAWIAIYVLVFYKVSNKLDSSRYYINLTAWTFLAVGAWLSLIQKKSPKNGIMTALVVIILFLAANMNAAYIWFRSMQRGPVGFTRDLKLDPHSDLITYGDMEAAYDYMASEGREQNKRLCLALENYQFNSGFDYISKTKYPTLPKQRFSEDDKYFDCVYFYAGRTEKGKKDIPDEYLERFQVKNSKQFAALMIWEMDFSEKEKQKLISTGEGIEKAEAGEEDDDERRTVIWADIFKD